MSCGGRSANVIPHVIRVPIIDLRFLFFLALERSEHQHQCATPRPDLAPIAQKTSPTEGLAADGINLS
jgi:hypothetical protein